eukprot:CAMPEP_0117736188 /NCGR_PEP_ID=MMETSP0947-20121206/1778_1 /TAXON_ID=44440 /ORGANISM="Chattonella subsalsa, Strain CCMP2191" /LENGTH=581 /DNA_ID=CAMNT_0005551425 /DNA_START=77 /DNA_END=1822 /DNA_ORIENTATION=-
MGNLVNACSSKPEVREVSVNTVQPKDKVDDGLIPAPCNPLVTPLLTDMYQFTMAYAYWKNGRHDRPAVFDLFFRTCPFKGQFCIFAGLTEVLKFVGNFKITDSQLQYLREQLKDCEEEFFDYLANLDCSEVQIHALKEGTVCFPREPLIRVSGPLGICQLLETTLLTLVGFPSLVATQACRMKMLAGPEKILLEFGLRRAQGADGGCSASYYACLGGFHATSNMQTGFMHNVAVKGTHAHSFVQSYMGLEDIEHPMLKTKKGDNEANFVELVMQYREQLKWQDTNPGELAAFIAYALSFPNGFLALIDTYDSEHSGNLNFILVALALDDLGYKPVGIRLDSGDLAALSKIIKQTWKLYAEELKRPFLLEMKVVASNDINEKTLTELNAAEHEVDIFGIGTHLATCQKQPALGCVYKLAEYNGYFRMKISNDYDKVTIPGKKDIYRLFDGEGMALADIMVSPDQVECDDGDSKCQDESVPRAEERVLCVNPRNPNERVWIRPTRVEKLHELFWDKGVLKTPLPSLEESKDHLERQLKTIRDKYLQLNPHDNNPSDYKVSVSRFLYNEMKNLWEKESPIRELK